MSTSLKGSGLLAENAVALYCERKEIRVFAENPVVIYSRNVRNISQTGGLDSTITPLSQ